MLEIIKGSRGVASLLVVPFLSETSANQGKQVRREVRNQAEDLSKVDLDQLVGDPGFFNRTSKK